MLAELEAAQGLLKYLHHHVKIELEGLDEAGLNWVPAGVAATNSLYGLTLHIATSQVAFAGALAHQKLRLDIPGLAEVETVFQLRGTSVEQTKTILRQAAELTNEVFENVTLEQLDAETTLPGGGKGTGHSWVQLMVMHTGEHMGHMSLTRQLYQSRQN